MGVSDVHLKPNTPPCFRLRGVLEPASFPAMNEADLWRILDKIIPKHLQADRRATTELDFSYNEEGVGRFRANLFLAQYLPTLALRHVKTAIPDFAQLNLPATLDKLAASKSGLILVCGATSSGKSSTLAAMIDAINLTKAVRIITIEDPIEYVFKDKKALITQREVGLDTSSFQDALKHILRQDPDVIMIGEMRDRDSLTIALNAAETGHVVFSTLHANSASQAIQRILNFYEQEEREAARHLLASNLKAIICQKLVPAAHNEMRPAVEIMINTPSVRKFLQSNKLDMLQAAIETGSDDGMQTFNKSLYQMIKSGIISEKTGLDHSPNAETLQMNLRGIFLDQDHRILS